MLIHTDCLYYKGHIPCNPHKKYGVHCENCEHYTQIKTRILIIKLGAIGDVIRTTPLLKRLRKEYPDAKITWLTLSPEILPQNEIEEILPFTLASLVYLEACIFDILINLDKDVEASSLAAKLQADKKFGYTLKNNAIVPIDENAAPKYYTGLFDDVSKANTLSYAEEIFNICGFTFEGETNSINLPAADAFAWNLPTNSKIVGLNTGCGGRWITRLWPNEHWIQLIALLQNKGYTPLLLGGTQEHENNQGIANATGALYFGHFPLPQFIHLMNQCDTIVTQVTMAMHIGIALQKKVILMNNIFNSHEFNLFGNGEIIEPNKPCDCFYRGICVHGISCMNDLPAEKVFEAIG